MKTKTCMAACIVCLIASMVFIWKEPGIPPVEKFLLSAIIFGLCGFFQIICNELWGIK